MFAYLQAANKGMREAVAGFVFSIYALIVMLSAPVFGKIVSIFVIVFNIFFILYFISLL